MRCRLMRTCFGCCDLRTAVVIIAVVDVMFGLYDMIDFGIRAYHSIKDVKFDLSANNTECLTHNGKLIEPSTLSPYTPSRAVPKIHDSASQVKATVTTPTATTVSTISSNHSSTNNTNTNTTLLPCHINHHIQKTFSKLYKEQAFAQITIGAFDVFIASSLLFVAVTRRYQLRVAIFVAAIWSFVMGFLVLISFGITLAMLLPIEASIYCLMAISEIFCGYVILSYFKQVCSLIENNMRANVDMVYCPEESITDVSEIQMEGAPDEMPIIDDNDDEYMMGGDDDRIPLT